MARISTKTQRFVFVFWELGFVLRRTVEGDSGWVREEWAEVLVGSAEPTLQGPEQAFF